MLGRSGEGPCPDFSALKGEAWLPQPNPPLLYELFSLHTPHMCTLSTQVTMVRSQLEHQVSHLKLEGRVSMK